MKKSLACIAIAILIQVASMTAANAQTFTDIHNFDYTHGGYPGNPGVLAQGRDGNLYGTTPDGGKIKCGVFFRITTAGDYTDLYDFDCAAGSAPVGGLTLGSDGRLYGSASEGGTHRDGLIFAATANSGAPLYNFSGTQNGPYAPPVEGYDGNYYGATVTQPDYSGMIYRISSAGEFSSIATTTGASYAPLFQANDGNFYGTIQEGVDVAGGSVFRVTFGGEMSTVYAFDGPEGEFPYAPVIQGNDDALYGTTEVGGAYKQGVVFKVTLGGTYTLLHSFGDPNFPNDGLLPFAGLVQATNGNFYGVASAGGTSGNGVIFQLTPDGTYSIVYNFTGADGSHPFATPMQHTNGKIYGLAEQGGSSGVYGVVYSFDLGLGPFVKLVINTGRVGEAGEILGQGFTGTTSVSINGVPASFTVVSDTYLTAVIPQGAATGYVQVVTPSGTLISNQQLRVLP